MTTSGPQTFTPPRAQSQTLATILIVAQNAEATLAPCLKSLLKQSLKQIEILVLDYGSSDETPDILASAATADSRIRVITKSAEDPLATVMNVGLKDAQGRYISVHHVGGISAPDRLAHQIQHLQNSKNAVLCACAARQEFSDGSQKDLQIEGDMQLNTALGETVPFLMTSAVFDRGALLNAGGFEGEMEADILYDAAFKLVHKGKFIGEPKLLYVERKVKPSFAEKMETAKANLRLRNRYMPGHKLDNLKAFVKDILAS